MRALVTGATGFIGANLCRILIEQGHEVVALVRPASQKLSRLPRGVEIIEAELDQAQSFKSPVDCFFHLAWNGSSGAEREDYEIQLKNLEIMGQMLHLATQCNARKFLFAGSQAEYGIVKGPCDEEHVCKPFMMYGAAKLAAGQMGSLLARQLGIPFVWARIYSVYGSGENLGTLRSYVLDCLQQGKKPELTACENMWNFMHVDDCCEALIRLAENPQAEGIYNIAAKESRILREYVEEWRDEIAPDCELGFGEKQADPERTFWLEPQTAKLKKINYERKK